MCPEEYDEAGAVTALAYREFGPANSADPQLRHRDEEAWDEYYERLANVAERAEIAEVFVAVDGARILGTVTLELYERIGNTHGPLGAQQAHIRMLGVDPELRRQGVARALIERCIDRSRKAGKSRLTLNTTKMMEAARQMYESLGFERQPDEVHPDGFVLLSYSMELTGSTSPDASNTPSSHSAWIAPPRNCSS